MDDDPQASLHRTDRPPDDRGAHVEDLACLATVSPAGRSWLASQVASRTFAAGDVLISQGETTRECYFIVDGETEVVRDGVVLGRSGAGEPEGELGLFLRLPRSATTTAMTTTHTLVLPAEHWDELCETDRELADHIRVEVCRHLARRFGLPGFAGVPLD